MQIIMVKYVFIVIGINRFHECMRDHQHLDKVIKEGEEKRLKKEIFGNANELNEINVHNLYIKKTSQSKEKDLNEKWLAYWLVYGTNHNYRCKINYYGEDYLNIKEYLYVLDDKYYESKLGSKILKELTSMGVEFIEKLHSVEKILKIGERYDCSGKDVSKEMIEKWYEKNKQSFKKVPQFTKETAYYLRDNYPATFEKLKTKLKLLHLNMEALHEEEKKPHLLNKKFK